MSKEDLFNFDNVDPNATRVIHDTILGKRITYTNKTEFHIQTGKGKKGSYRTRIVMVGNLSNAFRLYGETNISLGEKKRLYCDAMSTPVIIKDFNHGN
jgi:hypothetical protein